MHVLTKLHKLIEAQLQSGEDLKDCVKSLDCHYIITQEIIDAMSRSDIGSSINALLTAEIYRLPYNEILIEFEVAVNQTRFVWLEDCDGFFKAKTALLTKEAATLQDRVSLVKFDNKKINVTNIANENNGNAIAIASSIAMLLLNIKGIDRNVIECQRLNKQRVLSGKIPIPKVTILKIGTVYKSNGDKLTDYELKNLKKFHIRSGHIRHQRIGEKYSQTKMIYIEPTFVNFDSSKHENYKKILVKL